MIVRRPSNLRATLLTLVASASASTDYVSWRQVSATSELGSGDPGFEATGPSARGAMAATHQPLAETAALGDDLWIFGGIETAPSSYSSELWSYSVRTAAWTKVTPVGGGGPAALEGSASQDEDGADGDEAARSPLQMVESLNSLSIDIARAIDHETFIDLWERYKRGERHVFTRRLYTLQGQQTFDEISQKYSRDPEFRTAVERYVADFEQLLAQVSRNDRDNMLGQTYLTSDTGKVYTMLAHASGRLR